MSSDFSQYVLRKPRHAAAGASGFPVAIRRSAEQSAGSIGADLVDLSRDGFRLRLAAAPAIGESVALDLCEPKSGIEVTLSGTVRWCQAEADGQWLVGCQSERQLDWETLGELFLNNVLDADRR